MRKQSWGAAQSHRGDPHRARRSPGSDCQGFLGEQSAGRHRDNRLVHLRVARQEVRVGEDKSGTQEKGTLEVGREGVRGKRRGGRRSGRRKWLGVEGEGRKRRRERRKWESLFVMNLCGRGGSKKSHISVINKPLFRMKRTKSVGSSNISFHRKNEGKKSKKQGWPA